MSSIAGRHTPKMKTDEWLTPPDLLEKIGPFFDLDPCAATGQPWRTAVKQYTREDDGLSKDWSGFVFCNPPYGRQASVWLERMADHGNGIALVFARTETAMFHKFVWQKANAVLFLAGRLTFCRIDGTPAPHNSGGPSCLVAYGRYAMGQIFTAGIPGHYVDLSHSRETIL